MTNSETQGNRAFGELTCPNAQKRDQGAYSCEAINSKGSCFAGSAGCGQPGQDAIVVVNTGDRVCGNEDFNSLASTADECIPCFCFGVTSQCSSAEMYHSSLSCQVEGALRRRQ